MSTIEIKRGADQAPTIAEALDENGHRFVFGKELGFREDSVLHGLRCCFDCGVVRRADGKNHPCRGQVNMHLRRS